MKKEYVIIHSVDNNGQDEFMCLSGERIETETDPSVYPFEHAVTLRLSPHSAARIGQEIITVSEAEILQNCELPKATELPAMELPAMETASTNGTQAQLTLFGTEKEGQLSLF